MPASGLPLALGRALDALCEESLLTSWNIRGGKYTTVTLTFREPFNNEESCAAGASKTYRAKPPSAIRRDTNRRKEWMANRHLDFMQ